MGLDNNLISEDSLLDSITAVSVGIIDCAKYYDFNYEEDYVADVDMNISITGTGRIVEIRRTAEKGLNGLASIQNNIQTG